MPTQKEIAIISICNNEHSVFFKKPNVNGIALGQKIIAGTNTKESCIKVFVNKKVPDSQLKVEDRVPTDYRTHKTDVVEVGNFAAHGFTTIIRPMQFGYSIGPEGLNIAGTAGCLVRDYTQGLYILSNYHILANNPTNKNILQPAVLDGGTKAKNFIAILSKSIPLKFSTATSTPLNYVDCAIAKINAPTLAIKNIATLGAVTGKAVATLNMTVKKVGRSTGVTTGTIVATNATVKVNYNAIGTLPSATALFVNQIITTNMSLPGDSGSVLLDSSRRVIGLLFAGSPSATIHNPIDTVLSQLGVSLVL